MRLFMLLAALVCSAGSPHAQLPFYTDDPDVTVAWKLHFEFFNEYDALQSAQFPNLRQNTANFRLNYGLPHHIELDIDVPYLEITRSSTIQSSNGFGDTDMGIKWNFQPGVEGSHRASARHNSRRRPPGSDHRSSF